MKLDGPETANANVSADMYMIFCIVAPVMVPLTAATVGRGGHQILFQARACSFVPHEMQPLEERRLTASSVKRCSGGTVGQCFTGDGDALPVWEPKIFHD
jgi:hypothetical protein